MDSLIINEEEGDHPPPGHDVQTAEEVLGESTRSDNDDPHSTVAGVETDEASRFIDHTMATNLEAFITDIEQGLKQLLLNHKSSSITKKAQRTELTYQDQSYLLEVRQVPSQDLRYKNSHTSFALSKRNWIQSMLHHDVVICFYKRNSKPSNNSTTILDINGNKIGNMGPTMTSNHNMNHVQSINIMSAFTIAVKAVMDFMSVHLPVLYAYDIFHENNMGVTEVTVGFYQKNNKSNNENDDERGQQASSNTKKKHNTSMNHMEDFSDSGDEPNPNNPHDSAENSPKQPQDQPQQRRKQKPEQYRYECYLYDDVSKHKSLFFFDGIRKLYLKKMAAINAASGRVLLDDNFHIIATNYYDYEMNAWNKARAQLTSQARAFHGTSHLESLFSSPIIAFLNENYSLESFKGYNLIHLSNIQVQLDYRERIQQSVLDNESYSTFVAARQPHQHYHLVPSFTFSKMAYAYGNDLQGLVVQKLHPSSSSSPKSPALHGGGHRPVGKVVSTASSSSVGDKSSGKASEHAQSSHAPHIPSSSAATAALEQRAIAVLESIAWRSQNLRKFLTLFISSSLQVFKTYELSEGMSTMEQGDSVPKDIISSILNSLSEESRKILTTSSDYQSYLQSYSHITATLTSSKQPRALGSNISLNNINIANISTSSLSSLPAAPVAPASDAAPSIQPPELSFGYSNSPKPSDEGREEREQELLQHLMMHLFHAPLQQQQPPDEPHPAAAPSATTTSASASPLPSYHAGDMKHFLQQFVLLLSFAPMPRLATILRAWQHILRELQEMIDTADVAEEGNESLRFLSLPPIMRDAIVDISRANEPSTLHKQDQTPSSANKIVVRDAASPIYSLPLWDDVLLSARASEAVESKSDGHVCLPSLEDSLVVQKLQMVAFSYRYRKVAPEVVVENAFLSDKQAYRKHLDSHLSHSTTESDHHACCSACDGGEQARREELNQSLARLQGVSIGGVQLARRVPPTSDVIHMQKHIATKLGGSNGGSSPPVASSTTSSSRAEETDPFLRYHVCMPTLLQDMTSFRQSHPTASLEVFLHWYGLFELLFRHRCECEEKDKDQAKEVAPKAEEPPKEDDVGLAMSLDQAEQTGERNNDPAGEGVEEIAATEAVAETVPALAIDLAATSIEELPDAEPIKEAAEEVEEAFAWQRPCTNATNCRSLETKIQELWGQALPSDLSSPSLEGSSQGRKHIFNAFKEADKALVFLEKVPINALLVDLLAHLMKIMQNLLQRELQLLFPLIWKDKILVSSRWRSLQEEMQRFEEAALFFRKDFLLSRKITRSETVRATIQLIRRADAVINKMDTLEHLIIRGSLFNDLVDQLREDREREILPPRRLAFEDVMDGRYTLSTPSEAQQVLRIMKTLYAAQGGHDYISKDGRDLGVPVARKFVIKAGYRTGSDASSAAVSPKPQLQSAFSMSNTVSPRLGTPKSLAVGRPVSPLPPSPLRGMRLDFHEERSGQLELDGSDEVGEDVEVVALVDANQLRLAFITHECD